jgi:hypothetical protein
MPKRAPDILVAGIVDVVAREVRAGRVHELVRLTDELASTTVAILGGLLLPPAVGPLPD